MKIDFNHHAYLIEGTSETELLKTLKKSGVEKSGNPDFLEIAEDSLSIGNARQIRDFQSKKAFNGSKKIILIGIQRATREAQNALLKTLEEPTKDTYFFIMAPSREIFLPTVLSRLLILDGQSITENLLFQKFLKSSLKKRLELSEEIIKEKDKRKAGEIIDGTLLYLKKTPENASYLNKVLELKKYLSDRSPNLKQILEYAVINFPK